MGIGSVVLCGGSLSYAQTAPRVDLGVTFTSQRSLNANSGENFWADGGSVELGADAWHGFGIAAKVTGVHGSSIGSSGIPLSLVTATFGPRYRWHSGHKLTAYGEGLLGEANGFGGLYPGPIRAESDASSLALEMGGGMDVTLFRHLAIRVLEASWTRTQLPNNTNDRQNSLRVGAGVVMRLGR